VCGVVFIVEYKILSFVLHLKKEALSSEF